MKTSLIIFATILIVSCNNAEKKSDAYGNFEADKTTVSSEIGGKILYFNIEEGDLLSENKIVAQIDTLDLYYKKLQIKSQINSILANFGELNAQLQLQLQQLENVEVNKKRIETLLLQNAATQQQFDDITGQYKVAKKQIIATESKKNTITQQVEILKEQQKQIELNISKCTIKNPIAGSVLSKLSMKGENTTPGKPLYSIADLSFLKLKAYISGNKLSSVELGEKVKVLIDGKNGELQPIEGTIVWISESAEFTPKTIQTKEERVNLVYAIKIKVKNTGNIKIGMPAEVVFNNNK